MPPSLEAMAAFGQKLIAAMQDAQQRGDAAKIQEYAQMMPRFNAVAKRIVEGGGSPSTSGGDPVAPEANSGVPDALYDDLNPAFGALAAEDPPSEVPAASLDPKNSTYGLRDVLGDKPGVRDTTPLPSNHNPFMGAARWWNRENPDNNLLEELFGPGHEAVQAHEARLALQGDKIGRVTGGDAPPGEATVVEPPINPGTMEASGEQLPGFSEDPVLQKHSRSMLPDGSTEDPDTAELRKLLGDEPTMWNTDNIVRALLMGVPAAMNDFGRREAFYKGGKRDYFLGKDANARSDKRYADALENQQTDNQINLYRAQQGAVDKAEDRESRELDAELDRLSREKNTLLSGADRRYLPEDDGGKAREAEKLRIEQRMEKIRELRSTKRSGVKN